MIWGERDGDHGLRAMCDYGVKTRGDATLKFDLFNRAERDFVHAYMVENYPGVTFYCTYYNFKGRSHHG